MDTEFTFVTRVPEQAKALDAALVTRNKTIDKVVYIKVSEQELLKRLSGRWICRSCQAPYHATDSPPRAWGKCDKCGGELFQRSDDTEKTVRERLRVYKESTLPLTEYYKKKGILKTVDGEGDIAVVFERLLKAVKT